MLSGSRGALGLIKLRKVNADHARELDSLTAVRAELAVEKVRLEKDSGYIESVARKNMGIAKPGENVFCFIPTFRPAPGQFLDLVRRFFACRQFLDFCASPS